ncbi:hypothetical protein DL89DRAFT_296075 [Linderina pennispora]|uniref:Amino acid transporter transmembrane domain-containing protein n=1 Tax=Linderina pennispora TaxID=61395 RepID=A0A1Y1VWG6_9FUNG|nr:uncharacterized protein DL89DRAFT_296075 [Linderina pennispora]ORX65638.1 hypothetical protein DL89DRAFT_296075 [Linderina pennispora]
MHLPRFKTAGSSNGNGGWNLSFSDDKGAGAVGASDSNSDLSTVPKRAEGQAERKGSTFGAFATICCVIIGSGSLQLPLTLKQSGWIGLLLVIMSGIIGTYTGMLVIKSLYMMSGNKAAFGLPGRLIIYFFHAIYVIGIVGDYIILSGTSFHTIAMADGHDIGKTTWMVICALVMWLATISLKQIIVTILIAIIQSFMYPYKGDGNVPFEHHKATHQSAIGSGVPLALTSISFSFCAVVVMPGVEASMKNPNMWSRVLGSAMTVVTGTYVFIATVGYWAFGDQVVSPVLDNLPHNAATKAAQILIAMHVIFAAPVMTASLSLELELALGVTKEKLGRVKEFIGRFIFRTIFFGIMTAIAIVIPYFGDIISLVGAFSTSILLFIVPVACYLKLLGWSRVTWYQLIGAIETLQEHIREDKNN